MADWIDMSGFDSTCGLASLAFKPKVEDAVIIKVLKNHLLATPLFRSNVNQGAGCLDVNCFANSET